MPLYVIIILLLFEGDGIFTLPLHSMYVHVTHEASYVIVCQSPLHFAAEGANEDIRV